jgi:hypothetical protein
MKDAALSIMAGRQGESGAVGRRIGLLFDVLSAPGDMR